MTAKTLPCSSPPMTICAAWFTPSAARLLPERRAGGLADRNPNLLLGVPQRHDGVIDVEPALRDGGEIVDTVDAGIALEMADMVAQLRCGGSGAKPAQRVDDDHAG